MRARVAEWQTRYFEGVVSNWTCGFKSRFSHHDDPSFS